MQKLTQLQRFLFDEDQFPFDYESTGTYPAVDAFRLKRGNCVSFTILFLSLARAADLPVRAALPKIAPVVEMSGDLVVISQHLVAIYEGGGKAHVFDFDRSRRQPIVGLRPVDELWVAAIYLNNLGAEALQEGRLEEAERHLEHAVALAPDFVNSYSNLGVVRRRRGDLDGAFRAYRQSLELEPGQPAVLTNLASLYLLLGRTAEARAAMAAAKNRGQPAYMQLIRGDFELRDGNLRQARRRYKQAARRSPGLPDVHLALARADRALGRPKRARREAARALELDPENAEAQRMLEELEAPPSQGGIPLS
jgi:Flp pilus assembly protein TadD